MKKTLEYIVQNIVEHPDDVVIEEREEEGITMLSISVHKDDMGQVIGKNGKIIHALRNIMKVQAVKSQKRIRVELVEQLA